MWNGNRSGEKPALISRKRRVSAAVRTQRAFVGVRLEKEAAERRLVYGQEASALLAHDLNNGLSVSLSNLSYVLEVVQGESGVHPVPEDALVAPPRRRRSRRAQ